MLKITGDVVSPGLIRTAVLRALPQYEREVTFACKKTGVRSHRFTGPLLIDVACIAGPVFDPGDRKDRLRFLISLRSTDGYRTVLTWGEIDPEFGNAPVLLGLTKDGRDLSEEGPHLVVPGDKCGARSVSGIIEAHIYIEAFNRSA